MKLFDKNYIKIMISVFFIFIITLFISTPLMKKGLIDGHDNVFHFSQIKDLYDSIKNGTGFSPISPSIYRGIGYGTRLFYASFSHTITVIIGLLIEPFGYDLNHAFKIVIFLSIFISGLMMYFFVKRMTKNSFYGLISAILYMAFPYRITDIYIRNAFAETLAFAFLPGVFWGIYEILNQEKNNFNHAIKGYIILIINFSLLFFTHNITSVYCLAFALIIILFNFKKVINIIKKNKINVVYILISLLLILGITSSLWVSILEQRSGMTYAVFNTGAMRSTLDQVLKEMVSSTGFLVMGTNDYPNHLFYLIICLIIPLIVYLLLKANLKGEYRKYLAPIISILLLIFMPLLIKWPDGWQYRNSAFWVCLVIITMTVADGINKENFNNKNLMDTIGFATLLFLCFNLLYSKNIWKFIPSLFYNIQFPWRLWSFVILFGAMLIPLIMNYIKVNYHYKKIGLSALAIFAVIIIYPVNKDVEVFFSWQNRAFPAQFFDDNGKENRSELYLQIRDYLDKQPNHDKVDVLYKSDIEFHAYSPNKNLIIRNEVVKAPVYSATITISEKTLIQIPFIYYDRFEVTITNLKDTRDVRRFFSGSSDFLVAFEVDTNELATYRIHVAYHTPFDINNYPAHSNAGGWQLEYFPYGFFDNEGYNQRSELYKKIRSQISKDQSNNSLNYGYSYNASIVTFEAESPNEKILIENQIVKAPHFSADVSLKNNSGSDSEKAVIQIPFLYYTGYSATITNLTTNKKVKVKPYAVDFLLAIDLNVEKDTIYKIDLNFTGTTSMQISNIVSPICIIIVVASPFVGYAAMYMMKYKKKSKIIVEDSKKEIQISSNS